MSDARHADMMNHLARITIEQSVDPILWLDSEGWIKFSNEATCTTLGYSYEDMMKKNILDFAVKFNADIYRNFWKELLQKKKITFESVHRRNDGSLYPIEVTAYYVECLECEDKSYSCNFFRDISERKEAEQALRESEERFRSTFEQAPVGVSHVCVDTNCFLRTNETLCNLVGYSKTELLTCQFLDIIHPVDSIDSISQFNALRQRKIDKFTLESRLVHKDGNIVWVQIDASLKHNKDNQVEYIISIVQDISTRKAAENELQQLKNRLHDENMYLKEELSVEHGFGQIIGRCDAFIKILKKIEQVAPKEATVLILGESGTGKELIARAVHDLSDRKRQSLVKINCAALPSNLIESELFGHEKGAFTGAVNKRIGRFELANKGTIFLDEIGDLPLDLQAKLLRVLQEGEFERLGSMKTIKVDVRIIAATNRNLEELIKTGRFREDLYYRLNVFPIQSPPLKERKKDIPELVQHFIHKHKSRNASRVSIVPNSVMEKLRTYPWPGNVRELENVIERALITSQGEKLELDDFFNVDIPQSESDGIISLAENERCHIMNALEITHGQVSGRKGAAELLKINPKTLSSRMKKLGISTKS